MLEFSIQICLLSKDYLDAPVRKVKVLAIITDPKILTLTHTNELIKAHCHEETLLNFGQCNVTETTRSFIEITNSSFQCQEYGFLDLPDVIFNEIKNVSSLC